MHRTIEARSQNQCCSETAITITYFSLCVCACSLVYPARKAYVSCLLLSPGSTIFSDIISQTARFSLLNRQCVFWFSLRFLLQTFLTLRTLQRDIVMHVNTSTCKYRSFLSDFNDTWIFSTDFRKNIKCHQNPLVGSRVVACRQTDGHTRHDKANSA